MEIGVDHANNELNTEQSGEADTEHGSYLHQLNTWTFESGYGKHVFKENHIVSDKQNID